MKTKTKMVIPLTPHGKEERVQLAKTLLHRTPEYFFLHCVFVDELTIYIMPPAEKGWQEKGEAEVIKECRMAPNNKMKGSISVLLAIVPLIGVVYFTTLSPTTGHPDRGKYSVSFQCLFYVRGAINNKTLVNLFHCFN